MSFTKALAQWTEAHRSRQTLSSLGDDVERGG